LRRRLVSVVAACAVFSVTLVDCARRPSRPPHVVLIVLDTLRADALGCYNPEYPDLSPEIDALARLGVRFSDVTAPSSWTRPAMGSMLTARYPRSLGIYRQAYDILPEGALTLAEALRQGGYETAGITANPNLNRLFNFHQGFDTYFESDVVWDWMRPEPANKPARRPTLPDSRTVLQRMLDHARARSDDKPLYMQLVLMEVHEGWKLVRPEFKRNYRELVGAPAGYWDGVRQVSFDVGGFVERLSSLPGWADALIVVASDHGQGLDDHPDVDRSWGHGLLLYESQVKVPLILYSRAPARPALSPRQVDVPVRLMDLMPTILDYVGVPIPAGLDGRSVLPLLGDPPGAVGLPPYFVSETYYDGADKVAAHSTQWNYIENRDGHQGVNALELQPAGTEENGKHTDKIQEHPEVARTLARYLRDWEGRHPKRAAMQPSRAPSGEAVDQLKALGYVN
jgi:arylsulfatase A-like enzyme